MDGTSVVIKMVLMEGRGIGAVVEDLLREHVLIFYIFFGKSGGEGVRLVCLLGEAWVYIYA